MLADLNGLQSFSYSGSEFTLVNTAYVDGNIQRVATKSNYVYAAGANLNVFYHSDVFSFCNFEYLNPEGCARLQIEDNSLYFVGSAGNSQVYDLINPTAFLSVSSLQAGDVGFSSTGKDNNLFVALGNDGLKAYGSIVDEFAPIFTGDLSSIKYKDRGATVVLKDKLWKLSDNIIGSNDAPVSFTNIIPSDIAWDIMTCYGQLDPIQGTENTEIDYSSFLAWAEVFSADSILMDALYDGTKVLKGLKSLIDATKSSIWANEKRQDTIR